MAYSTFSKEKNDQLKEPMFFGNPVNVARYDQQKFEIFAVVSMMGMMVTTRDDENFQNDEDA